MAAIGEGMRVGPLPLFRPNLRQKCVESNRVTFKVRHRRLVRRPSGVVMAYDKRQNQSSDA